jgi:Tol biopolymer transport system component
MKTAGRIAIAFAAISLVGAWLPPHAAGQDLSAEAKSKEAAEARAKRDALQFENNATTIVFYDRSGKRTGSLGERALYDETVLSPDGSRVAVITRDLPNESADLFLLDVATGAKTRLTTSARTEFVMAPVWSPDGSRIAYVTILKGQEGIYVRAADGQGSAELALQESRRVHESDRLVVRRPVPDFRDFRSQGRSAVCAAARRLCMANSKMLRKSTIRHTQAGHPPAPGPDTAGAGASLRAYRWQPHCRGRYHTPRAA